MSAGPLGLVVFIGLKLVVFAGPEHRNIGRRNDVGQCEERGPDKCNVLYSVGYVYPKYGNATIQFI